MSHSIVFDDEPEPLVSVVIIAWQSAPHLRSCLAALSANVTETPYEIILILNEPDDGLRSFVENETRGIRTITTRVNVGYGGAVNLGVRIARGEFVVLLNDDTEVLENWLEPLVDTARRRPCAAAVGSTTLFPDGSIQEAGSVIWSDGSTIKVGRGLPGDSRRYDFERRVDHCSGTSLLVRRSSWEAIDGMDAEAFFPAYYEDTDFCLRLIENGEEVWYQPRSYVRHLESASTNSMYRSFLFRKNQAVFVSRWRERLQNHVDSNGRTGPAIQDAVWRAMGSPVCALVLVDTVPFPIGLLEALQARGRCHLTIGSKTDIGDTTALCALGVGVVGHEDKRDVALNPATKCLSVDIVVDLRRDATRENGVSTPVSIEGVPVATVVSADSDAIVVSVDGLDDHVLVMEWNAVIDRLNVSQRGEGFENEEGV